MTETVDFDNAQIKKRRAGKPCPSGTLMDTSGSINIVAWDYTGFITAADLTPYAPINCRTAVQQMRSMLEELEDEDYPQNAINTICRTSVSGRWCFFISPETHQEGHRLALLFAVVQLIVTRICE